MRTLFKLVFVALLTAFVVVGEVRAQQVRSIKITSGEVSLTSIGGEVKLESPSSLTFIKAWLQFGYMESITLPFRAGDNFGVNCFFSGTGSIRPLETLFADRSEKVFFLGPISITGPRTRIPRHFAKNPQGFLMTVPITVTGNMDGYVGPLQGPYFRMFRAPLDMRGTATVSFRWDGGDGYRRKFLVTTIGYTFSEPPSQQQQ